MQILRASHLGMCFGVRDAIALAVREAATRPVTILGELVHNTTVIADLQTKGLAMARDVADVRTRTVMVTAHGASDRSLERTRAQGLEVIEATCPLVSVAHEAIATLRAANYHPVIIGLRDHVEVRGLTEDLDAYDVVLDDVDVRRLAPHPRIGIAAQTTQPIERVRRLVDSIRERFPDSEVRFVDTVCYPTKQRQDAGVELARQSDIVVVIGGAASNNTRELVATCSRYCARVRQIQTAADLRREWFVPADTIGITAGTSTPDSTINEVEARLRAFAIECDAVAGAAHTSS
jgi:4-hydroxy-3-methylbut-2-enyl diphosphate reductase